MLKSPDEAAEEMKIYGLLLEGKGVHYLSIQLAPSLEEAFHLSKLEFEHLNPARKGDRNPLIGSSIRLFAIKEIDQMTREGAEYLHSVYLKEKEKHSHEDVKKTLETLRKEVEKAEVQENKIDKIEKTANKIIKRDSEKNKKNPLMMKILTSKNREMLEQYKHLLTAYEYQYINEQLNKKDVK